MSSINILIKVSEIKMSNVNACARTDYNAVTACCSCCCAITDTGCNWGAQINWKKNSSCDSNPACVSRLSGFYRHFATNSDICELICSVCYGKGLWQHPLHIVQQIVYTFQINVKRLLTVSFCWVSVFCCFITHKWPNAEVVNKISMQLQAVGNQQ